MDRPVEDHKERRARERGRSDRRGAAAVCLVLALLAGTWGVYQSGPVRCDGEEMPVGAQCVLYRDGDSVSTSSYREKEAFQQISVIVSFTLAAALLGFSAWRFGQSLHRGTGPRRREAPDPRVLLERHRGRHEIVVRLSGSSNVADDVSYGVKDTAMVTVSDVRLPWEAGFRADDGETVRIHASGRLGCTAKVEVDGKRVERRNGKPMVWCEYRLGPDGTSAS